MENWTLIIIALITTLPPTIMALLAWRGGNRNSKAIQEVHLSINSRMDELLKSSKAESKAEGKEEGRAENRV